MLVANFENAKLLDLEGYCSGILSKTVVSVYQKFIDWKFLLWTTNK